ncbi:MAG TPA: DUF2244 domain-containing protein [Gammaproteobacteria bacterium]|nr:DUF2244 domain-containing protein [Gammaproteobacteria bacterium]
MVERVCDPSGFDCHWVIRPNQSLSWRSAVRIYTVIALCCLGIGLAFALHGYWPVLLIAAFEVIVLGIAFYLCLWRSQIREVVTVNAEVVIVEKGRHQPLEHWECPRAWARVALGHSSIAWYPMRLTIAFQGRQVEIGRFLSDEERSVLADELQQMIGKSDWYQDAG